MMSHSRTSTILAGAAAVAVVLGACASGASGSDLSPSPGETISAAKLAIANLLPVQSVAPAPPGDTVVDAMGPVLATGVIAEPSRQVMTCTPVELMDNPGPAEPGAAAAASSGFVTGVAQVDQYVVVYVDEAAAQQAVTRSRAWAENCEAAFAVHSPDADATAVVSGAPTVVDGFRVHATYSYANTGLQLRRGQRRPALRAHRPLPAGQRSRCHQQHGTSF